jgi:hypothetical protein
MVTFNCFSRIAYTILLIGRSSAELNIESFYFFKILI